MSGTGHDFVRPFIMTGGRTESRRADLRFETLVQWSGKAVAATVPSEQVSLLRLAEHPISVAELGAELNLVMGVAMVLIDDLLTSGLLELSAADADDDLDLDMLTAIADKIRSL